ncbi:MAG: hypothetical protein DLM57_04055 [Pseudonocardiales bacterium]|nr:MAG: hypothetical protein DLM57_04055 [Pseudonocardiales bacterium]
MVIIGLLLIALVCLVLGLVLQSSVWLIASLIATGGAGFLLYKLRDIIAAPRPTAESGKFFDDDDDDAKPAATRPSDNGASSPEPAAGSGPEFDGADPDAVATGSPGHDDREVWVIDGRPRYHLGDCAIIKGQDAEAIPFEQATEDGFMPCSLCEPQAARTR